MRKSRSIHRLHLPGSSEIDWPSMSTVAVFAGAVPADRERQADVLARLQLGERGCGPRRSAPDPCARIACDLLAHDRIRRADQLGAGDVVLEHAAA